MSRAAFPGRRLAVAERLGRAERWWDESWAEWTPPAAWVDPVLPR